MQLHPGENWGRERQPAPVLQTAGGGERCGVECIELQGARHIHPLPLQPGTAWRLRSALPRSPRGAGQGRVAGQGDGHWGSRQWGRNPAREDGQPSPPRWAAMGCWRGRSTVLACLLLLRPPPSPACPAACRCSSGEADCRAHALREVPQSLSANTSALWLGYNFITVLGPRSFPPLPGLLVLSLPHNRLGLIHSQALVGLGALQELDLSNNYLTVLTPEAFLPLTSLATLNLGSNRLEELDPGVPRSLPQLQALLLQDNPWVCGCGILPLWRWLSHNSEKVQGECPKERVPKPPHPLHTALSPHRG